MNAFIRVTSARNKRTLIINTDSIELIGLNNDDDMTIRLTSQDEIYVKETIDEIWNQLKPNIIFA